MQVVLDRARLDRGERGGSFVGLAASGDHVDALVVTVEHDRGAELVGGPDTAAELLREIAGERDRIALDNDVDVEVGSPSRMSRTEPPTR